MKLVVLIKTLIDNTHPFWHFYWFFAIAVPNFFTKTVPAWLGWGEGLKPNYGNWMIIAVSVLYLVLLIVYIVIQNQYSREYVRQSRLQYFQMVDRGGATKKKRRKNKR